MGKRIAIIGGGNLGTAIAEGLLKSKFSNAGEIIITKRNTATLKILERKGVTVTNDNVLAVKKSEIVILAVKPFQAADVLAYLTNTEGKYSNRPDWGDKQNIRWMLESLSVIPEPNITFRPSRMQGLNNLLRGAEPDLIERDR